MKELKKALLQKREKLVLSPKSALSTGSTLLNLACSSKEDCGFIKGKYYYLVGDSTSGKTWLSMTCFAESQLNSAFANHELYFDDVEDGALMEIERFFGSKVAQKMRRVVSDSVQAFYRRLDDLFRAGKPFIYVLDSQDALDDTEAKKKFQKQKAAAEKGQVVAGSMGVGKAKYHSENIRWVLSGLRKTGSILIIIGQTRDNLNPMSFEKKTRSGGKALKFYATTEIWTAVGKSIKKTVRGVPRKIGVQCIADIRKNRVTGRDRVAVQIPIYNSFGIDDVGSCVDYLLEQKHWPKKAGGESKQYQATELKFRGSRSEIIRFIESSNLEDQLRKIVGEVWRAIEKECDLVNRKRRYV